MNNRRTSIGTVLIHAGVQLSVPTVISTASTSTKSRSYSMTRWPSPKRKIRNRFSSISISLPKRSYLNRSMHVRDAVTQLSSTRTVTHKSLNNSSHSDNSHHANMATAIVSTSKEYVPNRCFSQYSISSSRSSTKSNKSIKDALFGIWQGINADDLKVSPSTNSNFKYFEERVKKVKLDFIYIYY